jgi:transposase
VIQITPQMRVLVAIQPPDFRKGIDGLSQVCRAILSEDPMGGTLFVFRSRAQKAIKLLVYDGQGFWLAQKRMSQGKFRYWPTSADSLNTASRLLLTHEFYTLIWGGNPSLAQTARCGVASPSTLQEPNRANLGARLLRRRIRAHPRALQRRAVVPRHPLTRILGDLCRVAQQFEQIVERIHPIELCGMDERHERVADASAIEGFIT